MANIVDLLGDELRLKLHQGTYCLHTHDNEALTVHVLLGTKYYQATISRSTSCILRTAEFAEELYWHVGYMSCPSDEITSMDKETAVARGRDFLKRVKSVEVFTGLIANH